MKEPRRSVKVLLVSDNNTLNNSATIHYPWNWNHPWSFFFASLSPISSTSILPPYNPPYTPYRISLLLYCIPSTVPLSFLSPVNMYTAFSPLFRRCCSSTRALNDFIALQFWLILFACSPHFTHSLVPSNEMEAASKERPQNMPTWSGQYVQGLVIILDGVREKNQRFAISDTRWSTATPLKHGPFPMAASIDSLFCGYNNLIMVLWTKI